MAHCLVAIHIVIQNIRAILVAITGNFLKTIRQGTGTDNVGSLCAASWASHTFKLLQSDGSAVAFSFPVHPYAIAGEILVGSNLLS